MVCVLRPNLNAYYRFRMLTLRLNLVVNHVLTTTTKGIK
jgi:hypothetical protein